MNRLLSSIAAAAASLATLNPAIAAANATEAPPDPVKLVDAFEGAGGKFEGYRRSGAKGICAMGEFVGSAEGRALSAASVFSGKTVPVIVRFSVGGGNPKAADNAKSQRNMALQFNRLCRVSGCKAKWYRVSPATSYGRRNCPASA